MSERHREASIKREAAKNHYIYNRPWFYYRRNAKLRKLTWQLTREEFAKLVERDCFYCGDPPELHIWARQQRCQPIVRTWNGIDRLDSSIGYVLSNCVPACSKCNLAKGSMSVEEFISHIYKIAQKWR